MKSCPRWSPPSKTRPPAEIVKNRRNNAKPLQAAPVRDRQPLDEGTYYELLLAPPSPPANVPKGNKSKTYVQEHISMTEETIRKALLLRLDAGIPRNDYTPRQKPSKKPEYEREDEVLQDVQY